MCLNDEERFRFFEREREREVPAWERAAGCNNAAQAHASPSPAIPRAGFYRLVKEMVDLTTLLHSGYGRSYKILART